MNEIINVAIDLTIGKKTNSATKSLIKGGQGSASNGNLDTERKQE